MQSGGNIVAAVVQTGPRASLTTFIRWFSAAIGWLLVIVGWIVVWRGQNWQQHRREVRELIAKIGETSHSVEEKAQRYLTLPGDDKEAATLAVAIKRDFKHLSGQLRRLQLTWPSVSYLDRLIEFRQTVTGGDFETRDRQALDVNSIRAFDASTAADELLGELEQQFVAEFQTRRWFPWGRSN